MAAKPDKPLLWLVRQPKGLVPYSRFDADRIDAYRIGAHLQCYLAQPRDPATVRRFNGLCGLLANGTGEDFRSLKNRLKVQAGSISSVTHVPGLGTTITPESIADLDQADLEQLWDRVVQIVLTEYLPFIDKPELIAQINSYIGVQP